MITVYGIETIGSDAAIAAAFCWNDMITVYGIETACSPLQGGLDQFVGTI